MTQEHIIAKRLKFYVIDAYSVALESKIGSRINTIMQTCFFAISGVLPREEAINKIKHSIQKTYGKKGDVIVEMNFAAVDNTLDNLYEVNVPAKAEGTQELKLALKGVLTPFISEVIGKMTVYKGDALSVSQIPADGTWPTGTTQYEKRDIAHEVPVWDPDTCIQSNICVSACPHSVIRSNVVDISFMDEAPEGFVA